MYGRFIQDLLAINPDMRIVGFTATPYRTDSGRLDEGDERLFTEVVYDYGIANGIRDGYLSPLVSKATDTGFDMSGVARRGGDYVPGALNAAVDKTATTQAAVREIVTAGASRNAWLVFCAGVQHAEHVRDEFRACGMTCEMVTGDTPSNERARILRDFKSGKIKCVTNNSVLTTGFNHPGIDLIADLRPTLSCVLYVQIAGRGTRPLYAKGFDLSTVEGRLAAIAAGPKPNCLYMDFSGNVSKRHGPVDTAQPRKPGEGDGEAPCKECPQCRSHVHISAKVCPDCEYKFPENEKPKHAATSAAAPILSTEAPKWLNVQTRKFYYHENAEGSESVRVEFLANFVNYKLWLSVRKARGRCDKFWRDHGGREPYPTDVEDWLDRIGELKETAQIQVRPKGKFFEIVGMKPAEQHAPPPSAVAIQSKRFGMAPIRPVTHRDLDDDIPF
jgi:DNA repair protein RadD